MRSPVFFVSGALALLSVAGVTPVTLPSPSRPLHGDSCAARGGNADDGPSDISKPRGRFAELACEDNFYYDWLRMLIGGQAPGVNAALRIRSEATRFLSVGEHVVDVDTLRIVTRPGSPRLTPKAAAVLLQLARRRGTHAEPRRSSQCRLEGHMSDAGRADPSRQGSAPCARR